MSFFSSSPQQRFPDEDLDDYIHHKTPGKSGSPSKISSVNNSLGDHHNRESPLKHADLSPVYRDQSESLYSSNPTSYFPASPVPKIIITEAMKIGSGRKSKENGLFSPDIHSNLNENYKRGMIMSPPKKGYTPSPKKENIQKSPHRIAEMYNSPNKGSNSRRKHSENEDQHSDDLNRSSANEPKKPLYEINLGNLRNPPATSYAGAPGVEHGSNTSNRYDNSLVGSVEAIEVEESTSKQYNRASLPASPGNRREQFEQPAAKVYATTHSPKAKLRREYEEPIIIQDTPTVYKNIEFKTSLAKAFGEAEEEEPVSQNDLEEGDLKSQNFDLRRYRGNEEGSKKDLRNQYQSNHNLVIPEASSRAENLESSMGMASSQRGSHKQKQTEKTSVLQEHVVVTRENILQTRSAAESPRSHKTNARRMSHSRASSKLSSKHSDKDFDSRIENWTVDNFTTFPGGDPQRVAEIQDRANSIIKTLRKSRDKFIDIIFLPNATSLVNNVKRDMRPEWKGFEWHRLSEIYRQLKPTLNEEVTPIYMKPGLLKNTNFLTVVAALAEYPAIVRSLIHNQTYNNEGCYSVKVCRDGAWKSIVVDDFVPCVKDSNRGPSKPAFLRVQNEDKKIDIWPQIYEKAWAKVFDTYQNLETMSIDQMLRNALGAPCVTYELRDLEYTWNILSEAFSQDYIVVASIHDNKQFSNEEIYKRGLNPLYGNTILDISLTRTSPSEARTIKLRNIWNEEHAWEGGYKERGSEASEKEKAILLTLQEFCSIFTHLHVSQYNENYVYRSTTMRHVHQAYSIAKFKCEIPMQCFFEANQIDHRFYRGDQNYQYSTSRMLVFKGEGGSWKYIGGNVTDTKCNTMRLNLSEGEYYMIGIMDWKDKVHDFTVSAYGEGEVKFERVHYRDNPSLLARLLESYFLENSIPKVLLKNKDFVKYEKVFEELNGKGELFVNNSTSKVLNIHKKVNKIQNASLLNWSLGANDDLKISLQPGSAEVFFFGAEDLTKISTYVSEDIVHETNLR